MKQDQVISDEYLNAFVDDQLDMAEKNRVFDLIEQDGTLKARVCELRGLKKMIQHAYEAPPVAPHLSSRGWWRQATYMQTLAACLLLVIGGASGWFAHYSFSNGSDREMMRMLHTMQRNDIASDTHKLMIHVGTANQIRLKSALDEAENLLAHSMNTNRPIEVEIIANGGGLALLRADVSPFAQRINTMREKYPSLALVACNQSIRNLRAKGVEVRLLPNTGVASSALDEITLRLKQGWGYIKV